MRPSNRKYPLKPWAQKTKDSVIALASGAGVLALFYGMFVFFTNIRSVIANSSNNGFIVAGPPSYVAFAVFGVMGWFAWMTFSQERFWPFVTGLWVASLIVLNLVLAGTIAAVLTILLLVAYPLVFLLSGEIHKRIYDHSGSN